MTLNKSPSYYLRAVAENTSLSEKEEGIRRVLFSLFFLDPNSTKDIARFARLPLPVTAAIRKEFENGGVLKRTSGLKLTEKGHNIAEDIFQTEHVSLNLSNRNREIEEAKYELSHISAARPKADRSLDQSHSTVETQINRVKLMLMEDSIFGRDIAILGDDDLTGISVCILAKKLIGPNIAKQKWPFRIKIFECDERLVTFIKSLAKEYSYPIDVVSTDLSHKLGSSFLDSCDIAFTDPPYTKTGVRIFLSRAVDMLKWGVGKKIYLSIPKIKREEMLEIFHDICKMNLLIDNIIPGFNRYMGNSLYSNTSDIYLLSTCHTSRPIYENTLNISEKYYTFDINPKIRSYRCINCNQIYKTGSNDLSIDQLKENGCTICKSRLFERTSNDLNQNNNNNI